MNDNELIIVRNKLMNIKKTSSEEHIRTELFSILPYFIFDTTLFKRNIYIKDFLIRCDSFFYEYKDYVYASRTLLLSKIIRTVSESDKLFMYNMILEIRKLDLEEKDVEKINVERSKKSRATKKRKNYTDELFNQFERGK